MKQINDATQNNRIYWVDIGKTITIALIYFFHICQIHAYGGFKFGEFEYRILSPIISFFFFMSGFVFKPPTISFRQYLLKLAKSLLVPLFFFNLLSLLIQLSIGFFYQGPMVVVAPGSLIQNLVVLFGMGFPAFNGPTWYLTCMFSIQIISYFLLSAVKSKRGILFALIIFSILGYYAAPVFNQQTTICKFFKYFWYFPMSLSAIVFFLAGLLVRQTNIYKKLDNKILLWILLFSSCALTIICSNLNITAYQGYLLGQHLHHLNFGNYFLFYLSYFSMTTFLLCVSSAVKPYRIITLYGQNVLIVFGICGIFYHFINRSIGHIIMTYLPGINQIEFSFLIVGITLIQLSLCYPFFTPLNACIRYLQNLLPSDGLPAKKLVRQAGSNVSK